MDSPRFAGRWSGTGRSDGMRVSGLLASPLWDSGPDGSAHLGSSCPDRPGIAHRGAERGGGQGSDALHPHQPLCRLTGARHLHDPRVIRRQVLITAAQSRPQNGYRCDRARRAMRRQRLERCACQVRHAGVHRYRLLGGDLTERPERGLPIRHGDDDGHPVDLAHDRVRGWPATTIGVRAAAGNIRRRVLRPPAGVNRAIP